MPMNRLRRLATATVLASAAMIVAAQPASAQEEFDILLPAGLACPFELGINNPEFPPLKREFTDRNGNPVRLFAGQSGAISYTNTDTGESVSFNARGTRLRETTDPTTGLQTLEFSGQVGLILFESDVPAGPSTTQISGRLVVTFDPVTGFTEVQEQRGRQIDICAELA
jgi:hypothetical protein